ncbi:hypothetical protein [Streptomyces sp. Qhu_M48]|uniref:hypothetical protein n=1 Tax=Streptomyces sp. Qhu_M48 TaxID=3435889 RepID=UPI003F4FC115
MTGPEPALNSPRRKTWPYAVTAVLVYAFNEGWSAADVIKLAAVLLVLVALVIQAGRGDGEYPTATATTDTLCDQIVTTSALACVDVSVVLAVVTVRTSATDADVAPVMTKHSRKHDECVSGVRAELLGAYWTDAADWDSHERLLCPFCRALEDAEAAATRSKPKDRR